jgi:hypothetical protein
MITMNNSFRVARVSQRLLALAGAAFLWAASAPAADTARITFTKSFPGSVPAYVSIAIERSGAGAYKEAPDDEPETFKLENQAAATLFDLADKLDHFKRPLESGLKVANMGAKTFRWEDGVTASEAKFNYSQDVNAQALLDGFECISDSERAFFQLRLAVKHDKLGVQDAMLHIQDLWEQRRLVGTQQFLPLFDRMIKDESYLHMARERAAALAAAIRATGKAE